MVDDPDGSDEPAEVEIIDFGKDSIKNPGTFAVKIIEKLPSLVAA